MVDITGLATLVILGTLLLVIILVVIVVVTVAHRGRRVLGSYRGSIKPEAVTRVLKANFSLEELRELCFEMGIDYDSLTGENKPAKVDQLVARCQLEGRYDELAGRVLGKRPNLADELLKK
jgi:hypothetical protein